MKKNLIVPATLTVIIAACSQNKTETITEQKVEESKQSINRLEKDSLTIKDKKLNEEQTTTGNKVVDHYICFTEDQQKKLVIWMSFNTKGEALQVKYKGQEQAIDLVFVKKEPQSPGYPAMSYFYNEVYDGELNGQYIHTHSGVWDYVTYIRKKDGKKFNFTIDHDAKPYHKTPCFGANTIE